MGLRKINVPRSEIRLDRLLDALLRMETYGIRRALCAQDQRVGCGLQVVFRFGRPFANNLHYAFTVWHTPLSLPVQRAFRSFLRFPSGRDRLPVRRTLVSIFRWTPDAFICSPRVSPQLWAFNLSAHRPSSFSWVRFPPIDNPVAQALSRPDSGQRRKNG